MAQNFETRVTPWTLSENFREYGLRGYRIWNKQTAHGMFQRHEWLRDDDSTDLEEWIVGCSTWAHGAKPVLETATA